ncbi:hypothetical protein GFY24_29495 [Nocardia sp. SYP-A9097]|uniref:hypothetical protein n=1 Tax=Nocardia sp. SYP-A9097 TaxID=2663237 RepID=UPI00132ADF3B|nr:hypothetical protein [Nocardia sp. SYP-A9097]MRH91527.1 hypothetical protein [Nocardia sp. SYP-A9097]
MPFDDRAQIELQVIQDVLDIVDARLRERELHGWRLTVPRSRIYAAVLLAVIVSARESHRIPATLDRAAILDVIFDGLEPSDSADGLHLVEDTIRSHTIHPN